MYHVQWIMIGCDQCSLNMNQMNQKLTLCGIFNPVQHESVNALVAFVLKWFMSHDIHVQCTLYDRSCFRWFYLQSNWREAIFRETHPMWTWNLICAEGLLTNGTLDLLTNGTWGTFNKWDLRACCDEYPLVIVAPGQGSDRSLDV